MTALFVIGTKCTCDNTAVKRVLRQPTHDLCGTRLEVVAVQLDDDVDDECRTFVASCAAAHDYSLSRALHNYLVYVGVLNARFESDDANRRIVVVVASDDGTTYDTDAQPVTIVLCVYMA